jgi:hypothetical protein
MTAKFLQIGSGENTPAPRFEIFEVQKNIFELENKNSHVGLLVTLENRLKSNFPMGES